MRIIETKVYTYDELNERAKERAREWYTSRDYPWPEDYEFVYEDAAEVGKILGFDICQTCKGTMSGKEIWKPTIYWSGFWSQGDGACFEGTYRWKSGCLKAIKEYAPNDKDLHDIAEALTDMQRPFFYKLMGRVKHRGHYHHERSMDCTLDYDGNYSRQLPEEEFADICADFAMWIYKQLEAEYEYRTSEECVAEALIANEYEFDEEGNHV